MAEVLTAPVEVIEADEVILAESTSDNQRRLYVYDPRDDFIIEIPAGAKVTFGYFNPAASGDRYNQVGYDRPGATTMKTTALRVYERGEKGNQLACFMGVSGFRDIDAVKKTVKRKKVTIETNFEDDGLGNNQYQRRQEISPLALTEGEEWEADESPF